MARRHKPRSRLSLRVVLLAGATALSCGATPRDQFFGTDAGAGFEAPPREVGTGTDTAAPDADDSGAAGQGGSGGDMGTGGAGGTGGSGGAGGTGGDVDAASD
jgi:hypothetical protein